jgi:membrane protein YdbS with pleckstrin-like domain
MAKTYLESLLGENERIVLITRQHWFLMISAIIAELIATIVIIAAVTLALPFNPLIALGYIVLILPVGHGIYDFLRWWNVEYVVTNRRVIHLSGVLNKNVTDSSLEKVNDVKMEQSVFGRIFDYGDVEILTASEMGINLFKRIGDPVRFKTAMINAKEHLGSDEEAPRPSPHSPGRTVPELIAELDQLRKQGVLSNEEFEAKKRELLAKI